MEIRLGESDSFLNSGEAKIVIIHVTCNDGKKVQFPYPADKPISEIYKAVERISTEAIAVPSAVSVSQAEHSPKIAAAGDAAAALAVVHQSTEGEIEREDIVKCIKVNDRGKGATVDLFVGREYRVIKVKKFGGAIDGKMVNIVDYYEVIDDNLDPPNPRRIFTFPDEVVLLRKRVKPVPKVLHKVEETFPCELCHVPVFGVTNSEGKCLGFCSDCNHNTEFKKVENAQSVN